MGPPRPPPSSPPLPTGRGFWMLRGPKTHTPVVVGGMGPRHHCGPSGAEEGYRSNQRARARPLEEHNGRGHTHARLLLFVRRKCQMAVPSLFFNRRQLGRVGQCCYCCDKGVRVCVFGCSCCALSLAKKKVVTRIITGHENPATVVSREGDAVEIGGEPRCQTVISME